jgi:hypothetical protein
MAKNSKISISVGFNVLLTIVFVVLKLTKAIDWSWVWVLSPVWISAAFAFVIWLGFVIALVVAVLKIK